MKGLWQYIAVTAAGIVLASVLPLSPALVSAETRQARLIIVAMTIAVATACRLLKIGRSVLWTAIAGVSALAAIGFLFVHVDAAAKCVATYDGRPVLIGREYTPVGADYVGKNPGLAASDLLLDAGGVADRIWTSSSISSCRFWTGWGGLLAIPLFVAALCALISRRGYRVSATQAVPPGRAPAGKVQPAVYDAFISYRHTDADRIHAEEILEALESRRLRVAIDFRDFAPNEHFLSEMERCVKTSRFVLCVITSRYLESDHTSEEALISKTLDMADRKLRLVPLIFEAVELPIWLHGLVGIDFTPAARVDPLERLLELVTHGNRTQGG
jgi:TIR domain